jgi:hypothetical protein
VHARGRVYPISSAVTPEVQDLELSSLDAADPQTLSGWNGNFKVVNYVDGDLTGGVPLTVEQSVGPNAGEDFLYDPPTSAEDAHDQFAQVGIYYHLTRMRDYFVSTHQIDMGAPGWKLVAVANMLEAGRPMDNAFFSGEGVGEPFRAPNLIAIGQGSFFDFSDDSDVFLHEFTHYVSANAVGYNGGQFAINEYGLSPWAGSIDEGIADYFACTVNGDSTLGEATLAPFGMARDLAKDTKTCPGDLVGEVHEDGELIGSLAWSLREKFGAKVGDKLVWGTVTLLTPNASFGDFAKALKRATGKLVTAGELTEADAGAVDALIESRGLDDCEEVLDLTGGKSQTTNMLGIDSLVFGSGASCADYRSQLSLQSLFHFKSKPDPAAKGVRFTVELDPDRGSDVEWSIYVRARRHVGFTLGERRGDHGDGRRARHRRDLRSAVRSHADVLPGDRPQELSVLVRDGGERRSRAGAAGRSDGARRAGARRRHGRRDAGSDRSDRGSRTGDGRGVRLPRRRAERACRAVDGARGGRARRSCRAQAACAGAPRAGLK